MKKAPAKMKKASMAKKKGEKMPMKKDPKTGKMIPAFLMKKGSMAKKELVGKQKNLNEGLKRAIKAAPEKMKKAAMMLKKEEKSGMMMKKAAMKMKKVSAMKMKMTKSAVKMGHKKK